MKTLDKLMCVVVAATMTMGAMAVPLYQCPLTVGGYAEGKAALADFPVLVRISAAIDQFDYGDCAAGGADISFTDEDGETVYPHEIDTWNPDGESLVWVKLPSMAHGTRFLFRWSDPNPPANDPTAVWADYAGVWHLGEQTPDSYADSTGHGLTATNAVSATITEKCMAKAGKVGDGRWQPKLTLRIPRYDSQSVGGTFTASGWFYLDERTGYESFFNHKESWDKGPGWQCNLQNSDTAIFVSGSEQKDSTACQFKTSVKGRWVHLAAVYSGTTVKLYENGTKIGNDVAINAAKDNDRELVVGGSVKGTVDEIRICKAALSADWLTAESGMVNGSNFVTAGETEVLPADGIAVVSSWSRFGSVSPTYGLVENLADGESCTFSCTDAEEMLDATETERAYCSGWELIRVSDGEVLRRSSDSGETPHSCTVVRHAGQGLVLRWLWQRQYKVTATTDALFGTVSPTEQWVTDGEMATVTAAGSDGYAVSHWENAAGAIVSSVNPLNMTVGHPLEVVAKFGKLLTVATDGTGNYTDIAEAVTAANAVIADGESLVRIEVGPGTYQLKAVLQVTKAIELVGLNGAAETIIDGVNTYRVEINHAEAVVDGFTIRRGKNSWGQGANVNIGSSGGTLRNCHVVDCAVSEVTYGGGIHADAGLISHCLIARNTITQQRAAGVSLTGTAVIEYSTICCNTNRTTGQFATTVWLNKTAKMRNCTVYGNAANDCLIYREGGNTTLENCILYNNHTTSGGYLRYSNGDVSWCAVDSRYLVPAGSDPTDYKAKNCVYGDPCFDFSDPMLPITAGSPCRGTGKGGADFGAVPFTTTGRTFCDFTTSGREGAAPLEVAFTAVTGGFDAATVTFNWDLDGDGVYERSGTGLASVNATYTAVGKTQVSLKVTDADGNVLAQSPVASGSVIEVRPTVAYVKADSETPQYPYDSWEKAAKMPQEAVDAVADGGKVIVGDGTYSLKSSVKLFRDVTLESENGPTNAILRNAASDRCAVLLSSGACISGLSLRNGDQQWSWGGNCYMTAGTVTNCWLTDAVTTTGGCGGQGIYLGGGLLTHSLVARNQQPGQRAAGVCIGGNSTVMRNCVVCCNTNTATANGSGVFVTSGTPTIESCTIANNVGGGAGVNGNIALRNCIVWGNVANGATVNYANGIDKYVKCCTTPLTATATANGCIGEDPILVANDPMCALGLGSSCIDKGENRSWMDGAKDISGNDRIINDIVDIGANEYVPSDELGCTFAMDKTAGAAPLTVTFTATVSGADPAEVTFLWDFDNDGVVDREETGVVQTTYAFPAGSYSVKLVIRDQDGKTAEYLVEQAVGSTPAVCYVVKDNPNAAWPYEALENAAATIQQAIDTVLTGGMVIVGDGVYTNKSVITIDRKLTVKSANGPENCIVSGGGSVNGFRFTGAGATVEGFTVTECGKDWNDGGAFRFDEKATVANCIALNCGKKNGVFNGNNMRGAAAYVNKSGCVISNCQFIGCVSQRAEGAAIEDNSSATVVNCLFIGNECRSSTAGAAALLAQGTVRNCTFVGNRNYGGPAAFSRNASGVFENCIFADNYKGSSGTTICNLSSTTRVTYSCFWPEQEGIAASESAHILVADPLFVNAAEGNYRLQFLSPCRNVGKNGTWKASSPDLDGNPRIYNFGHKNGIVDLGCYENQMSTGLKIYMR